MQEITFSASYLQSWASFIRVHLNLFVTTVSVCYINWHTTSMCRNVTKIVDGGVTSKSPSKLRGTKKTNFSLYYELKKKTKHQLPQIWHLFGTYSLFLWTGNSKSVTNNSSWHFSDLFRRTRTHQKQSINNLVKLVRFKPGICFSIKYPRWQLSHHAANVGNWIINMVHCQFDPVCVLLHKGPYKKVCEPWKYSLYSSLIRLFLFASSVKYPAFKKQQMHTTT